MIHGVAESDTTEQLNYDAGNRALKVKWFVLPIPLYCLKERKTTEGQSLK